jgi:phage RecT family recombinase
MSAQALELIKTQVLATLPNKLEKNNSFKLDVQRELGFAYQAFQSSEYMQKATPESIIKAVTNVVLTGLTLNPVLQQACLVPRSKGGQIECCLEPMYQGLITKMVDTGQAKDVYAHVVYSSDKLNVMMGSEKKLDHVPYYFLGIKESEKGEAIGVYAVAVLPDNSKKWEFVPAERVHAIMQTSESYKAEKSGKVKTSIWTGPHKDEMWKKTAIKALFKVMPKNDYSERVAKILEVENETQQFEKPADIPTKTLIESTASNPAVIINEAVVKKSNSVEKNASKVAKKVEELNKTEEAQTVEEATVETNKYGVVYSMRIQEIVDQLKELNLYDKLSKWVDINSPHESMDIFLIEGTEEDLNNALNAI